MNKKIFRTGVFALISSMSFLASASQAALTSEEINLNNQKLLAKAGIAALPFNEIDIVPSDKYINKQNISKNPNDMHMAKIVKDYLAMNEEQMRNGYVKTNDSRARELLDMKHTASYHQKKFVGNVSAESTHIRASINNLLMAYTFVGVPNKEISKNLGIAPYGAFKSSKNGDEADGWDGAVQFFENENIGVCAFTEHNRKLAKSGVELIKELVTYDVQDRPGIVLVKGNEQNGFVYKVKWYDSTFSRELECSNKKFSQNLRSAVIALANRIESYQQAF